MVRPAGHTARVAEILGLCDDDLTGVREVLADLVDSGREPGGGVAVFRDGRPVVDLTFGVHRPGAAWTDHSLALSFSTGKPLVALTVLSLVADGSLALDDRLSRFWPDFAAAGKGDITVRDVLCHRSGLWAFPPAAASIDLTDEDALFEVLAAAAPLQAPGTAVAEHALTYGHLLDPVVRAITGRRLADHWASVARAHGWDAWLAVPDDVQGRVATPVVVDPGWHHLAPPGSDGEAALARPAGCTDPDLLSGSSFRRTGFPAISLHSTARSLADFYSDLVDPQGRVGLLLGTELHADYLGVQATGTDLVLGRPVQWTLGLQRDENGIGHGGLGGSTAGWDDRGYSYAYVSAGLGRHDRADEVLAVVDSLLDQA